MKNICKILLVMCCVCLCSFSGCDEKNDLYKDFDTKTAEMFALDYMNRKYDKDFYVVSSNKNKEMSYAPGKINDFWCDVEIAIEDSEEDKNYTVRTTLDDEKYVIEWDNYMSTLVMPLVKRDINGIISEMKITDYFVYSYYISEKVGTGGFKPDFNIDIEKDTLNSIFEKSGIWLYFNLYIPESAYKKSIVSEFEKALKSDLSHVTADDYVSVSVLSFDDDYYSEIKKLSESGNELPPNHEYKAIHEDAIKLN